MTWARNGSVIATNGPGLNVECFVPNSTLLLNRHETRTPRNLFTTTYKTIRAAWMALGREYLLGAPFWSRSTHVTPRPDASFSRKTIPRNAQVGPCRVVFSVDA